VTLVVWTNLTVSLDEAPTANTLMLKVLDQIYVVSPLAPTSSLREPRSSGLHGGEGGIRTLETLITFCGFQDRRIQPLCHLSTSPLTLILQGFSENGLGHETRVKPTWSRIWSRTFRHDASSNLERSLTACRPRPSIERA
jgi:hypothetical protein